MCEKIRYKMDNHLSGSFICRVDRWNRILSEKHITSTLEFAKRQISTNLQISNQGENGILCVRSKPDTTHHLSTVKHGGGKIMLYQYISQEGTAFQD